MRVGQFFILALFLTFLIFVLPVILAEFDVIPPAISKGLLAVKDVIIIKILGYSEETARFPDVIFSVIVPFGISLAVILVFFDFMQKNIFRTVSPSLFFFIGWFTALITTRFFGPMIAGFYAGLGLYGTVAFGAILVITIAIAYKAMGAGLKGLIATGITAAIISVLSLLTLNYIGLAQTSLGNIMWVSILATVFAVVITYMYRENIKSVAPEVIKDIDARLTLLREEYNKLLNKLNPNSSPQEIAQINQTLATLRTEMATLEEQKRKFLVEAA